RLRRRRPRRPHRSPPAPPPHPHSALRRPSRDRRRPPARHYCRRCCLALDLLALRISPPSRPLLSATRNPLHLSRLCLNSLTRPACTFSPLPAKSVSPHECDPLAFFAFFSYLPLPSRRRRRSGPVRLPAVLQRTTLAPRWSL